MILLIVLWVPLRFRGAVCMALSCVEVGPHFSALLSGGVGYLMLHRGIFSFGARILGDPSVDVHARVPRQKGSTMRGMTILAAVIALWVPEAVAVDYDFQGAAECRDNDGTYPLKFRKGYGDLTPHTDGNPCCGCADPLSGQV